MVRARACSDGAARRWLVAKGELGGGGQSNKGNRAVGVYCGEPSTDESRIAELGSLPRRPRRRCRNAMAGQIAG
ncbi:hypothetical protein NL676_004762 [Syzygium grande]|nr:hypothetical protein NL676_004762 [Syzygium grande]